MFNSIKTKLASRAYANPNTEQNEHKTAEPNKKRGVSGLVITLVLIAIAVVGGGIIAAIVLTSGSDTQDAAEEATNIGGIAVYDEDCRFSGTPIAVLHNFNVGVTGTVARPTGDLTTAMGGSVNTALRAQIRTVSGANGLSEQAHAADFTGDGIKDDIIPTTGLRVGFYNAATTMGTGLDITDAANIAIPGTVGTVASQWDELNLTVGANATAVAPNNNRVQIFVNRARDCWGMRRV